MPVSTLSEAVAVTEEVTTMEETAGAVDLLTVSQQLNQIIVWQSGQFLSQWVLVGCVIGTAVGKAVGRYLR